MRVICLSDTHGYHKRLTIPDGDLLIHCGDFSMRATSPQVSEFARWFASLPHRHKIIVAGNHDMACEQGPFDVKKVFAPAYYLDHEEVVIEGLKIFGSPYTPAIYNPSPWFFDYQRKSTQAKELWDDIPKKTDLLITHGPPKGILDLVKEPHIGEDPNVGDIHLLRRVMEVKPKVHVFGHIHEGFGSYIHPMSPKTVFYNVSVCDRKIGRAHV